MFEPLLYRELMRTVGLPPFAGWVVQLEALPEAKAHLWVIKLHDAAELHYDFRIEMFGHLLSFVLYERPSLVPGLPVYAKLVHDHQVPFLLQERRLPEGHTSAGPFLVADHGAITTGTHTTHDLAMVEGLRQGDLRFQLTGHQMNGSWRLRGGGEHWELIKEADIHASQTRCLPLDRSALSGRALSQIQ